MRTIDCWDTVVLCVLLKSADPPAELVVSNQEIKESFRDRQAQSQDFQKSPEKKSNNKHASFKIKDCSAILLGKQGFCWHLA